MTALLMTATIAPDAQAAAHSQFDPAERLAQYQAALAHYLRIPALKILFVDNSAHPLDALAATAREAGRPVHFHSYKSPVPPALGKGRGEMELIATALDHFKAEIGEDEPVWKVTGRLIVDNLDALIATQPQGFALYADCRDVPLIGEALGGNQWMDTKLIAFTPKGFRTLIQQDWPDENFTIEKLLYQHLKPVLRDRKDIVPRFRLQPDFIGTSGGSGKNYRSFGNRTKSTVRRAARSVAPWLWL
ncbi:hypothetical protein [Tabrizicola sp.]|uniref:hypothetical protein n=1 Tax=Tabrizicola sp. TaxID=2005166 RepID=UPI002FDD2823